MNPKMFGSGTIACSAILIYSGVQPSTAASRTPDCNDPPISPFSQVLNRVRGGKSQCDQQHNGGQQPNAKLTSAPERLLDADWGDRRSDKLPNTVEAVYSSLLEQAQTLANRNQPATAIHKVAAIPTNSQHFKVAQQLQEDWSRDLLRQAISECQQAHVVKAISMLNDISSTRLQTRVIELRQRWQQQKVLLNRAIAAKNAKNWQGVIAAIKPLEETPLYNSLLVQELLQQATTQLYEPDATMLQVAMKGLSTGQQAIAAPESITFQSR